MNEYLYFFWLSSSSFVHKSAKTSEMASTMAVTFTQLFLPRDAMPSCGVCLSVCVCVCLSVTFMSCVKTNKHVIKIFALSGSHAILVFLCQTA